MRSAFLVFVIMVCVLTVKAQNVINHHVAPVGVYQKINLDHDSKTVTLLLDEQNKDKSVLIHTVEMNANHYTPPVLYVLSNVLFAEQRYNEAIYWFYIAQLRARYDVNRCADKTANASDYNETYGPVINKYAFTHLDSLEKMIPLVIAFVRANGEQYDQRWINLSGMDAMSASLDGKAGHKSLSVDLSKWPAIKTKTVDTFYSDFKEAIANLKKKK